jgi:hypothetical protein
MFVRSTLLACAAFAIAAPFAGADTPAAQCAETSFHVYFAPGSATLNPAARDTIAAAERNLAACDYAELHVAVDSATSLSARRGQAILAALDGREWNVAQIERGGVRHVSLSAGPDYAEVVLTPRVLPARAPLVVAEREAGV